MKKIRNITDLQQAQVALDSRKLELEQALQQDWTSIKAYVTGSSDIFTGALKHHLLATMVTQGLSVGAGLLAKKFGGKIGSTIISWFK